jgi:hypothetical protein
LNPSTARSRSSRRALAIPAIGCALALDAASSQTDLDTDRVYLMRVDGNKMMVFR